jgi:predicted O-methyltransferase YrrM
MTQGGSAAYQGITDLPPLVCTALDVASQQGFDNSCAPEQGRLLSLLTRSCFGGRIGETGTGCGVGLAWMVDAADESTSFVSVELDATRAAASAALFADHHHVEVLQGDWRILQQQGPFDLLVLDGGGKGKEPGDDPPLNPIEWLAPGGTIVLDDFIPSGSPNASAHDDARRYWLDNPALRAVELRLSDTLSTIVGTRLP